MEEEIEILSQEADEPADQGSDDHVEIIEEEPAGKPEAQDEKKEERKNESNFKKLYKEKKDLERRVKELENRRESSSRKDEEETGSSEPDKFEEMERKIFYIDNKDAKAHADEIREAMEEYGVPIEKAWKIVKSDLPETSKDSRDLDLRSASTSVRKRIEDITPEQLVSMRKTGKLTDAQVDKWYAANGKDPASWQKKFKTEYIVSN